MPLPTLSEVFIMKVPPIKSDPAVCSDKVETRQPSTCFYDLPAGAVKGLSVGDEVVVTIKGKVKSVSQREDYDDKEKVTSSLDVEYNDLTVKSGKKSEWDELVEE
jgi:hypothetical protein